MVQLELMSPREQGSVPIPPYHEWVMPDGTLWAEFRTVDSGYLLRFPGLVDFWLAACGSQAKCWPVPGIGPETTEHLYRNQVLPLALSRRGKLVFHGSAVGINGVCLAFIAASGRGKSTLAAQFATHGGQFLTDDVLMLEPSSDGFLVEPWHPSLRLWEDSREQLLPDHSRMAPPLPYTPKARLLAEDRLAHCGEARALLAAYFLGDGSADTVEIRRLGPIDTASEWIKNSFLLEGEDSGLIAEHFQRVGDLTNSVPCYHLDYPRRLADLGKLQTAILSHIMPDHIEK